MPTALVYPSDEPANVDTARVAITNLCILFPLCSDISAKLPSDDIAIPMGPFSEAVVPVPSLLEPLPLPAVF